MKKQNPEEGQALAETLERIRRYLRLYEDQLFVAMNMLSEDDNIEQRSKTLETVVQRYEKVTLKFFEIGYKLENYRTNQTGSSVLDIDEAKAEILERLDRLIEKE